jgi:hypothetical protein
MADFKPPPQHVPLGTIQATGAKVMIDLPWYRAFLQLAQGGSPSPAPSPGGITFAATPGFRYGDLVFTSGPLELTRLPGGEIGTVLSSLGPDASPAWLSPPAALVPNDVGLTLAQRSLAQRSYGAGVSSVSGTTDILATQVFGA